MLSAGAWSCGGVVLSCLAVGILPSTASRVGPVVPAGVSDQYAMVVACVVVELGVPSGVVGGVVVAVSTELFVFLVAC